MRGQNRRLRWPRRGWSWWPASHHTSARSGAILAFRDRATADPLVRVWPHMTTTTNQRRSMPERFIAHRSKMKVACPRLLSSVDYPCLASLGRAARFFAIASAKKGSSASAIGFESALRSRQDFCNISERMIRHDRALRITGTGASAV
jgi:hypothetical protein